MPYIRIKNPRKPPESDGIAHFAADYTLTLNADHITRKTLDLIMDDIAGRYGVDLFRDAGIMAFYSETKTAHWNTRRVCVDFRDTAESRKNVMDIPPDLRECILYAASMGFNRIMFENAHPDDLPYIKPLTIYKDD